MKRPTLASLGQKPFDARMWAFYVGLDPARAPKGDYFGVSVNGLPLKVTDPWFPVPLWASEVRGMRIIDALRDLFGEGGALWPFRNFKRVVIDETHDPTAAEILEERYESKVTRFKYTVLSKESLWKDYYRLFKLGRRYPGKVKDPRLAEVWARMRRQAERWQLNFTESGRIKLDHHSREHDDLLEADMLSCWGAFRDMHAAAAMNPADVAVDGGSVTPRGLLSQRELATRDYGQMMTAHYTELDYAAAEGL